MGIDNLKDNSLNLMLLAKKGDEEAYTKLYNLYYTPIFKYIYFRVRDKDETNDLIQIVFLKVFTSLKNFNDQNKSPLNYFYTISRNTIIDYYRSKKPYLLVEDFESLSLNLKNGTKNVEELFEQKEKQDLVKESLNLLSDGQKEVIILKFIDDLSNKEIGELLNKSEDAIRQIQCRALRTLKTILEHKQK